MKVLLLAEHTGKDNYASNTECPIAMALREHMFTKVKVHPREWWGRNHFGFRVHGEIPNEINRKAMSWAENRSAENIAFELPEPRFTNIFVRLIVSLF